MRTKLIDPTEYRRSSLMLRMNRQQFGELSEGLGMVGIFPGEFVCSFCRLGSSVVLEVSAD